MQRPAPIHDPAEAEPPSPSHLPGGPTAESTEDLRDSVPVPLQHTRNSSGDTSGPDEATPLIPHAIAPSGPDPDGSAAPAPGSHVSPRPDLSLEAHEEAPPRAAAAAVISPRTAADSPRRRGPVSAAYAATGAPLPRLSEVPGVPHRLSGLYPGAPSVLSPPVSGSTALHPVAVPSSLADSSSGLPALPQRDASETASKGTQSLSVADMNEAAVAGVLDGATPAAHTDVHSDQHFVTADGTSVLHASESSAESILDQVALAAQRMPSVVAKPAVAALPDVEERMRSDAIAGGWGPGGPSSWLTDSSAAAMPDAVRASGSTPVPSGSDSVSAGSGGGCVGGSVAGSVDPTPGCWPCRMPQLRRRRRLWEPLPDAGLEGVTRLSPWLFSTANSSVMPGAAPVFAVSLLNLHDLIVKRHGDMMGPVSIHCALVVGDSETTQPLCGAASLS